MEESHISKLHYLDVVIKESLRLHPMTKLLNPHESMEGIVIDGYHIRKKSDIIVNNWGVGQDPRFIGSVGTNFLHGGSLEWSSLGLARMRMREIFPWFTSDVRINNLVVIGFKKSKNLW